MFFMQSYRGRLDDQRTNREERDGRRHPDDPDAGDAEDEDEIDAERDEEQGGEG